MIQAITAGDLQIHFVVFEHTLTVDTRKIFVSNIIQDRRRVQLGARLGRL